MRLVAIPRFDTGAEGIHLAWTGPESIGLSEHGYDVERRGASDAQRASICVKIEGEQLARLRRRFELEIDLGLVRYHLISREPAAPLRMHLLATKIIPPMFFPLEVFTLELHQSITEAEIATEAPWTTAIALSGGKAVDAMQPTPGMPARLYGQEIDTLVIYTMSPRSLLICVRPPLRGGLNDGWTTIARGLTLPVREADASLTSQAKEKQAARRRLVAAESYSDDDHKHLAPVLRVGASHPQFGRATNRIVLTRSKLDDEYQELSFGSLLDALQVSPRLRRVLGFGYADPATGLMNGGTYEYRVTGYFHAEDLADRIYDVRTVPVGTGLPAAFRIRDLSFLCAHRPTVVLDPPPQATAFIDVSRRGIQIDGSPHDVSWTHPDLGPWSVIIDFPTPVPNVILEVDDPSHFVFAALRDSVEVSPMVPLPRGALISLVFPSEITQLRLAGTGILFAVRIPSGETGLVERSVVSAPVRFAEQPPPDPPKSFQISNLQQPPAILTDDLGERTQVAPRPEAGFLLEWLPAIRGGVAFWPPDLESAPPLDALAFNIEHQRTDQPGSEWEPILGDDNLTLGSRRDVSIKGTLVWGADLDLVFPIRKRRRPGSPLELHYSDVFSAPDAAGLARPQPPFESMHQYRIRAMDTVGRISTWADSNTERLEKHVPPPLPVGPQPPPEASAGADGKPRLDAPLGARARAIVAGDPALTDADRTLLGEHDSAIVFEWGWRENERLLDPTTREFRLYRLPRPADVVPGTVTAVSTAAGGFDLQFETNRRLEPNEATGQWIASGGHPFEILSHGGGSVVSVHVKASSLLNGPSPVTGPAVFGRPLAPQHVRPPFWDERMKVVPVTAADTYVEVFHDVLALSPTHPTDTIWIGVSAADGESYVPDELPVTVLNGGRAGNESSIVVCTVSARYRRRPVFSMPPPLGEIPELRTEEPTGRQVLATLDLPAILGPTVLPSGEPIVLERCDVDTLLGITRLSDGTITLRHADGAQQVVTFANTDDQAQVLSVLSSDHPELLESRHLLFLSATHSIPDEIWERTHGEILHYSEVTDRLEPKPARCFYRIRRADAAGLISAGGAILPIVVRVPSAAPAPRPEKLGLVAKTGGAELTLRIAGDFQTTHLLTFHRVIPYSVTTASVDEHFELLRIPNRTDLFPAGAIRLRTSDGTLISPRAKRLADADVSLDEEGRRTAVVPLSAESDGWLTCWTVALTSDGVPSALVGPFTIGIGGA